MPTSPNQSHKKHIDKKEIDQFLINAVKSVNGDYARAYSLSVVAAIVIGREMFDRTIEDMIADIHTVATNVISEE